MEIRFAFGNRANDSVAEMVRTNQPAVLLFTGDRPGEGRQLRKVDTDRRLSAYRAPKGRLGALVDASLQRGAKYAAVDFRSDEGPGKPGALDITSILSRLKRQRIDVVAMRVAPDDGNERIMLSQLVPPLLEAGIDIVVTGEEPAATGAELSWLPPAMRIGVTDPGPQWLRLAAGGSATPGERPVAGHRKLPPRKAPARKVPARKPRPVGYRPRRAGPRPDLDRRSDGRPSPPDTAAGSRRGLVADPGSLPEAPDLADRQSRAEPAARFVNTFVAEPAATSPVPAGQPLARNTGYEILLNIGRPDHRSLLPASDGRWPEEQLPDGELRLRAVLRMDGMPAATVATLTLPAEGESFACRCPTDGDHRADCAPEPWLRFSIRTPARDRRWRGGLDLYYRAALVHAQRLVLPVGDRKGGPQAELVYRLTTSFANLGELAERSASILVSEKGSRVTANGVSFADAPFSLSVNAVDEAAKAARWALYDIHLEVNEDGVETSRYRSRHSKPKELFEQDLRLLARLGRDLFVGLSFHDRIAWQQMRELIRHEASARGEPPTLLIAEATDLPIDRHLPWALVYDIPVGSDPQRYRLCESVRRFGPGAPVEPVPPTCPESDHLDDEEVLCPYGFWGLSCLLEQPPSANQDPRSLVSDEPLPVSVLAAIGADLDEKLTEKHVRRLRKQLGEAVLDPRIDSHSALADELIGTEMDIAYLYAHCGNQRVGNGGAPTLYLQYGTDPVGPLEIDIWSSKRRKPRLNWQDRRPLVVLNGCHTLQRSSATLSDLAGAFVRLANAAGVLGTEVAVEQGLAGHVAEQFLELVAVRGQRVGDALRQVRWRLLGQGNVMGLAYTPYCLSTLTIRPQERDPALEVS